MTEVVVVGAGGFGREVLDVIEAHNRKHPDTQFKVLGVADDSPSEVNLQRLAARGYAYLGSLDHVIATLRGARFVMGVSAPQTKRKLVKRFEDAGWDAVSVIHPTAGFGSEIRVGDGTVICAGAQLTTNIVIGRHVHINLNVTVGHDVVLRDHVSINPGAGISGEVTIGEAVLVGTGAAILQGLAVGADAQVGAGACVVKPVEDGVTVVGVPARPVALAVAQTSTADTARNVASGRNA